MANRIAVRFIALAVFSLSTVGLAVIEKGQVVSNRCWKTVEEKQVCLEDFKGSVKVLIHNAGWCGPCNMEMDELAKRVVEFDGKPVTFLSLSAYGWTSGSLPTTQFLTEWRDRHHIPFTVAASPKDAGKDFFAPPLYIPNVVIVDRKGNLFYKEFAPEVDELFAQVNAALSQSETLPIPVPGPAR